MGFFDASDDESVWLQLLVSWADTDTGDEVQGSPKINQFLKLFMYKDQNWIILFITE